MTSDCKTGRAVIGTSKQAEIVLTADHLADGRRLQDFHLLDLVNGIPFHIGAGFTRIRDLRADPIQLALVGCHVRRQSIGKVGGHDLVLTQRGDGVSHGAELAGILELAGTVFLSDLVNHQAAALNCNAGLQVVHLNGDVASIGRVNPVCFLKNR